MAIQLQERTAELLGELRVAATPWRIRGIRANETVVDSRDAVLVWEPRRVTPVYAVPDPDVAGRIEPLGPPRPLDPAEARRPVLDPSVPFDAHTAPGEALAVHAAGGVVAAFRFGDPLLEGRIAIDFDALAWFEEDAPQVAHPRDPFHRIDVRPTPRHVVMSHRGVVVVETDRARLLAETMLPVRWYVPEDAVRVPLEPSDTTTTCAYKGRACYRSARVADEVLRDLFWTYDEPLSDGRAVAGLLGVFAERLEVVVDGEPRVRTGVLAVHPSV
ncbi:DUF427 domain-containing protein [Amnibacterium sp. CER49]|uniref:DUF427 domain-containing protein n=1 Tax=Amnibacterium sp. CER49 TaxID=3039161 RepID=UPI0024471ED1|nr:DUF427 domain-containing protein [Amnibacterium sp. CER49]MDH2444632.1 DUF427 domain-containing protein [Amnibacterium sp. CER49]